MTASSGKSSDPASSPTGTSVRDPRLAPVLLVNFIGSMGFSIVMPFLIFLVRDFGGNAAVYGLVGATYPAFQFIGAPLLGRWSDRYGRKRILLLSQAGTLLSWMIFALALYLPVTELAVVDAPLLGEFTLSLPLLVIVLARALDGLTGGNISVANAYVADISNDETRGRNFGRMGVAFNMGLILGPALASVLGAGPWGEKLPVAAAMALSLLATILIALLIKENRHCPERFDPHAGNAGKVFGQELRECHKAAASDASTGIAVILRNPAILLVLVLQFIIMLAFSFYYAGFPVHAATNLKWTVVETGIFFASLSFMLVVVEGPVLSVLSRRFGEVSLVISGWLIVSVNFVLMQSSATWVIYLAALLFAFGNGISWPTFTSVLARTAGPKLQGAVQGLAGSAGSLAGIAGLVSGGMFFEAAGARTFLLSAVCAFIAFALATRLGRSTRANRE